MRARRLISSVALLAALVPVTTAVPFRTAAAAARGGPSHRPDAPELVKGFPVPVKPRAADPVTAAVKAVTAPKVTWPAAGTATVSRGTRAAGMPVRIRSAKAAAARVELLDRAAARKRGIDGLLMRVRRADGPSAAAPMTLSLDYSGFRDAYGGDWAARLRLVELAPDGTAHALPSSNDVRAGTVSADVTATGADTTLALTAGTGGQTGDYAASSLSPAGTWSVSTQGGDFSWSYPIKVPETPGGLEPSVNLSYSSAAVDGHMAATNNQPSWVGEGWSLWPGEIERSYKACYHDIADAAARTGDLCWATGNATMSFNGHSSELLYQSRDASGTETWRPKNDDGSRVQHFFGGLTNGDDDNEWWKVTTTDGTQYFFGRSAASAWTVPVYGNDNGEPCHHATYNTSWCQQAYRWNLDHVVDTHGDTITYTYVPETNNYGRDNSGAKTTPYVRGGWLQRIEYGSRAGEHPLAQVVFDTAERGGPDVPTDQACANGANCGTHTSPTFWTTKRLATVTTQVWDGSAYRNVDRWALAHEYPSNQDGSAASLWLHGITHTGLAGPAPVALPQVTFDGTQLPNRLNSDTDGLLPFDKWRVWRVDNESGGSVTITYLTTDCLPTEQRNPATNTGRCFPAIWSPNGVDRTTDWMNKYVVAAVDEEDRVGGQDTQYTYYDYYNGMAWHHDDNPMVPAEYRTYSQYRGYNTVRVRRGDPSKGVQSATQYAYYRGMPGQSVPDSRGGSAPDAEQLQGFLRETVSYEGAGGPVLSSEINDPWQAGPGVTQGSDSSYVIRTAKTVTRTAVPGGRRTTEVDNDFNGQGLPTTVSDLGDTATTADDRCTTTTYARNETTWLLNQPSDVRVDGVRCGVEPVYPRDAVSEHRSYYDGGALGVPPTGGDLTRAEALIAYHGATPSWGTAETSTYDRYGRTLTTTDPDNHTTTTAYTPGTGLPTGVAVTDPAGLTTTSTLDLQTGETVRSVDPNQRVTAFAYDALDRLTGVWKPGRSTSDGPSLRYTYRITDNAPSAVVTDALGPDNNYISAYSLLDGFMRERQTQTPGNGGDGKPPVRVLTDTLYDSRGLVFQKNSGRTDDGTPGTGGVIGVDDAAVPSLARTVFDGAERPTARILLSKGREVQRTTMAYFGDHVDTTPPAGGTPTTAYFDAQGRTTELWQYHAGTPTGAHDVTRYAYTTSGQLDTVTDPAGNRWANTYDLLDRRTRTDDPDKGVSTTEYDNAGLVRTSTDARGVTLAYKYDSLGRKVEERRGSLTGDLLASWAYDTAPGGKGLLASTTRYLPGGNVTENVTGYDAGARPTGRTTTVPAALGDLAGNYSVGYTYKPDGSPATVAMPSLPGLGPETLKYDYNDLGQPYRLTSGGGTTTYVHGAAYSPLGEMSQVQLGNGGNVTDTYYFETATRRLTRSVVDRQGMTSPSDIAYEYDPAGNVKRTADAAVADNQCFTYDTLRRLVDAWTTTAATCGAAGSLLGGPAAYWSTYAYDAVGNRLTETSHSPSPSVSARVTTFRHPAGGSDLPHALTSVTTTGDKAGFGVQAAATGTYDYDAAGNAVTRPGQTLTWDAEGQLATVTDAGGVTSYTYGADSSLLMRTDKAGTALYLDGAEVDSDGTGASTATRYYTFGGATVAARTGSKLSWMIQDRHNTDIMAIDSGTLATAAKPVDPFGNARGTQPPSWPSGQGFVGGLAQPGVDLTVLGAREFDARTGTFISADPEMDPEDPQQLNAYAYADNNPPTLSDPDGRRIIVDAAGFISVPGAAAARQIGQARYNAILRRAQARASRVKEYVEMRRRWEAKMRKAAATKRAYLKDKAAASGGDETMTLIKEGNSIVPVSLSYACATGNGIGSTLYGPCTAEQTRMADSFLGQFHGPKLDVLKWTWDHIGTIAGIGALGCAIFLAPTVVGSMACAAVAGGALAASKDVAGCVSNGGLDCAYATLDGLTMGAIPAAAAGKAVERAANIATSALGTVEAGLYDFGFLGAEESDHSEPPTAPQPRGNAKDEKPSHPFQLCTPIACHDYQTVYGPTLPGK